jgi:hypothetical protein
MGSRVAEDGSEYERGIMKFEFLSSKCNVFDAGEVLNIF